MGEESCQRRERLGEAVSSAGEVGAAPSARGREERISLRDLLLLANGAVGIRRFVGDLVLDYRCVKAKAGALSSPCHTFLQNAN